MIKSSLASLRIHARGMARARIRSWCRLQTNFARPASATWSITVLGSCVAPGSPSSRSTTPHSTTVSSTWVAENEIAKLDNGTFFCLYPPTPGICAAGQVPAYRVFGNRADASHRCTTDRAIRDQTVTKGRLAEGERGADTVVMRAPD